MNEHDPEHPDPTAEERVRGLSLLQRRCAALPGMLEHVRALQPTLPDWGDWETLRIVVTGVGLAEGAARYLVGLWRDVLGLNVRFIPLTGFLQEPPRGDALIVFSQGLSPNAQLALERSCDYPNGLLITSVDTAGARAERVAVLQRWLNSGKHALTVPPAEENGLLLRVLGPTTSAYAALLLGEQIARTRGDSLGPVDEIPARVATAAARAIPLEEGVAARLLTDPILLMTSGVGHELTHGLRWKVLEGLWRPAPLHFDILQFAHGPLQVFHGQRAIALQMTGAPGCPLERDLAARMRRLLDPTRHTIIHLPATTRGALAIFEHDAHMNTLLCAALETTTRDLASWPMHGQDGALYRISSRVDLGAETTPTSS